MKTKLSPDGIVRRRRLFRSLLIALAVGIAYGVYVKLTALPIPCLFHLITGLYCPGCGVTRMCISLMTLDFAGAARNNLLVLCFLPFMAVIGIRRAILYVRTGEQPQATRTETVLFIIAFVLATVYTVLRNLPDFWFFAPIPYSRPY